MSFQPSSKEALISAVNDWCDPEVTDTSSYKGVDINSWDTSMIDDMSYLFKNKTTFNSNIGNWDTSNVLNMRQMFFGASIFNQNIGNWNTSKVEDMGALFAETAFNQDIDTKVVNVGSSNEYTAWDVSNVKDIEWIFNSAKNFNQDLNNWDVSSVTNMSSPFGRAYVFNGNISSWDVTNVLTMYGMFHRAYSFNQDIGSWNTSSVTNMGEMFYFAKHFNQDISTKVVNEGTPNQYTAWDVSSVLQVTNMFARAIDFDGEENRKGWTFNPVVDTSLFNAPTTFTDNGVRFAYVPLSSTTVSVTGTNGTGSITIPETFTDSSGTIQTVTKIEKFSRSVNITSIHIPASVTTIESGVFYLCSNLTSVTLTGDSNLTTLGDTAFSDSGITRLTVPESLFSLLGVNEGSGQTVGGKANVTVTAAGSGSGSGSSTGVVLNIGDCLPKEIHTNKIIQGACRVPSSLYTMTKASINVASIPPVKNDKHGSYARYLDRKKGKGPLLTQARNASAVPHEGNKTRMIGLMPTCQC